MYFLIEIKYSYFFSPEFYFLLLEVPPFFFVDEDQIQEISTLEPIVDILVSWSQICACKIKSDWNTFSLDRCAIHYFKFIEVFSFSDRILSTTHNFFSYYAKLHMFNFDSHQVEKDLTQNAIFKMKFATIKLKFNM